MRSVCYILLSLHSIISYQTAFCAQKFAENDDSLRGLPVEISVRRVMLSQRSEATFYVPDGDFRAAFKKKFGEFLTLTQTRYNFSRGEIEFRSEIYFTGLRMMPQFQIADRLIFVPLFGRERMWRREQDMGVGGRLMLSPLSSIQVGIGYRKIAYPSAENRQQLESARIATARLLVRIAVDSSRFVGGLGSAAVQAALEKAIPFAGARTNYWQLALNASAAARYGRLTLMLQAQLVDALHGRDMPLQFFGGFRRLAIFENDALRGTSLLYGSWTNRFAIYRYQPEAGENLRIGQIELLLLGELGQVGRKIHYLTPAAYIKAYGFGLSVTPAIDQHQIFDVYLVISRSADDRGSQRLYIGVQF